MSGTAVRCLPSLAGTSAGQGEGFEVVTGDGTRYRFDQLAHRVAPTLTKPNPAPLFLGVGGGVSPAVSMDYLVHRQEVWIMPTRVTDRFGNIVTYTWNAGNPWQLDKVSGSDGRALTLTYVAGTNRIATVSDGSRTWTYGYTGSGTNFRLSQVTQPDTRKWSFNLEPLRFMGEYVMGGGCGESGSPGGGPLTGTMIHPSGAQGSFTLSPVKHGRSWVALACVGWDGRSQGHTYYPAEYIAASLTQKKLTGPGLPAAGLAWNYGYGATNNCYQPGGAWTTIGVRCTSSSPTSRTVTVTDPANAVTRYTFGNRYQVNEGQLLKVEEGVSGSSALRTTVHTYADPAAGPYPAPAGTSAQTRGDSYMRSRHTPRRQTVVTEAGASFTWKVASDCTGAAYCFDVHARPTRVIRSSSLGYSRTDATEYHDDAALWVLGQTKRATTGSTETFRAEFGWKALPVKTHVFGKLQQSLAYDTTTAGQLGVLRSIADGNGSTTSFASWKRGIPQTITLPPTPDQPGTVTRKVVVDNNGWITQLTDENGSRSCYGYDAMGRLASITYPSEAAANTCDTSTWAKITQTFAPVASAEYGLPANHWKQTVSTGNGRQVTYFDALWRPVVEERYDTTNAGGTRSVLARRYDNAGRLVFQSYPLASLGSYADSALKGTRTSYDALGRITRVEQDSELGVLATTTSYQTGFTAKVTNPRGKQTTTSFMAFDQPTTDWPVSISHPEGVFTDIARDVFGKPTAITRRNANSSIAVTRNYVYDANQQLCKTLEPETGATLVDYDAAGNIAWSASGLNLSTLTCNRSSVAAGSRVNRSYDARNRLTTLSFPDGNGNQSWAYTPDGLPSQVTTYNDDGLTTAVNAYTYNKRRLPTGESISQPGLYTWAFGYGYNANGHLATHSYPGNLIVDYAPNALGQPTKAGPYATGVSYFPNGAMKQFTYGNGIVHTLVQNARGLPDRSRDAYGSLVVHDDGLDYDANGNVMAITDGATAGRGNRDMGYDGLDRLTGTVSPMFGTAVYGYDVLDNLTRVKVAGRDHTYGYDTRQRLTNVMDTAGGASVIGLGYDVRGNLENKNGVEFRFDHGNRLRYVVGKEAYRYDAHGRRIEATHPTSGSIFSMYGQDGVLRYQEDYRKRKATQYIHLNGSLVAEVSSTATVPAGPTLTAPATSNNGSFTISWSSVSGAKTYRLEESINNGAWTEVTERTTLSWGTSGRGNGSYRYRVRSCAMGCSGYSAIKTVTVALVPQGTPTLTAPAYVTAGSYTVSWTAVSLATRYELQEQANGGNWAQIHNAAGGSKAISGKASGTYGYRVRACNDQGCAGWSAVKSTSVELPPAAAPTLTVPAQGLSGTYTVSWGSAAGATSYTLEESANGGSWTGAYTGTAISKAYNGKAAGTYAYRIKACNPAGCSATSASKSVQVIYPPSAVSALTVPATNTTGSYTVSWTAVAGATKYKLQERPAGGGFATVHDAAGTSKAITGKTTGTYEYRVQACNDAGCGGQSAIKSIQVTLPPASAPTLTAPATNSSGSYTVSWTAVGGATKYQLQERPAGGSFATVHDAVGASKAISGKATGTYEYRARACNGGGCGGYSAVKSTQVTRPPTAAPTVTAPASSTSGSYTISWTAVSAATAYRLEERKQGGSWSEIHNASARSKAVSGKAYATWEYRARGCNAGGCGGYSAINAVVVAPPPPPVPTGLRATDSNSTCQIDWDRVGGATRYELESAYGIIYRGAQNRWFWGAQCDSPYKVRACDDHGCSGWSQPVYAVPGRGAPFAEQGSTTVKGGGE